MHCFNHMMVIWGYLVRRKNNEEICYRFRCYRIAFVAFELVQANGLLSFCVSEMLSDG